VSAPPLYFDHNATTPLLAEVVEAMTPFLTTHFGNPSSGHAYGRVAKAAVEAARAHVAALVESSPDEVVFTSGGTEATALALKGTLRPGVKEKLVTSRVEHPATMRVCEALAQQGHKVHFVGIDARGRLDESALSATLPGARWLSVIHGHNETGALQSLPALSALTRARGVLLHADASQSAGKVPLSLAREGFDLLTLAAHKLYGPKGVGALIVRRGVELMPQQLGAGHERGLRAGTENVPAIVGFGEACRVAKRDLATLAAQVSELRRALEQGLRAAVPGLIIACEAGERLPNTSYVVFPGIPGNVLLDRVPQLAASTGSACHDGAHEPPRVLLELGLSPEVAIGAVRLTLGRLNSRADVDEAVRALSAAATAR